MSNFPLSQPRQLFWVGSSKRDLRALPARVMDTFGYALHLAQIGSRHEAAKVLRGFGAEGVIEVVESERGSTFRAVYTVRYEVAVFVLHVFQKKSKSGSKTSRPDLQLIQERLKAAKKLMQELSQ